MIINLQYLFKPKQLSPGFQEGQEICVYKFLTDYAHELGLPCFVLQCWEGSGEDSKIINFAIVDKNSKQILFIDSRIHVCEYILESMTNEMKKEDESVKPS